MYGLEVKINQTSVNDLGYLIPTINTGEALQFPSNFQNQIKLGRYGEDLTIEQILTMMRKVKNLKKKHNQLKDKI